MSYAPTPGTHKTVIPIRGGALEHETVEIKWHLKDGGYFFTRHTCPPKATREAAKESSKTDAD